MFVYSNYNTNEERVALLTRGKKMSQFCAVCPTTGPTAKVKHQRRNNNDDDSPRTPPKPTKKDMASAHM